MLYMAMAMFNFDHNWLFLRRSSPRCGHFIQKHCKIITDSGLRL